MDITFGSRSKIEFSGRLTKDAELKTLDSGKSYYLLSVACNDGTSEKEKDNATFYSVFCWGLSEKQSLFFKKGQYINVTGRYTQKVNVGKTDGQKYTNNNVIAWEVNFPPKPKDATQSNGVDVTGVADAPF